MSLYDWPLRVSLSTRWVVEIGEVDAYVKCKWTKADAENRKQKTWNVAVKLVDGRSIWPMSILSTTILVRCSMHDMCSVDWNKNSLRKLEKVWEENENIAKK